MIKCAFCGSDKAKLKTRMANTEVGGLVKLNVCPVDEEWVGETFSRPLTMTQLINMQKRVMA